MRPVARETLPARAIKWLAKNQKQLSSDVNIKVTVRWSARRRTMNSNGIVRALRSMAGHRYRCMYCGDSEGCDVEHYFPKAAVAWRDKVFSWDNFLWVCALCNRLKNANFQVDATGGGVLLNPVADRIWDFFDYVDETGLLVERSDLGPLPVARAAYSVREDVTRLGHEVVSEGRQRSARILRRAMREYVASVKSRGDADEFFSHVLDAGHPELCEWFFAGQGALRDPYSSFVADHGALIAELRQRLNEAYPNVWQ